MMNTKIFLIAPTGEELDGPVTYDPNRLLDTFVDMFHLKTDLALSRLLGVDPPVISKIRNHRAPVGASLLIRMHEASDLTIGELRGLMGDRRKKFRMGLKYSKPKKI